MCQRNWNNEQKTYWDQILLREHHICAPQPIIEVLRGPLPPKFVNRAYESTILSVCSKGLMIRETWRPMVVVPEKYERDATEKEMDLHENPCSDVWIERRPRRCHRSDKTTGTENVHANIVLHP